jgi:hypothetical protein
MPIAPRMSLFLEGNFWMGMSSRWLTATSYPSFILLRFVFSPDICAEYVKEALFDFVLTCVWARHLNNLNCGFFN